MEIYVVQNDEESGPYDLDEIHRLFSVAAIHPNDLAWHVGLQDWQPLHTIAGVQLPRDHHGVVRPPPLPKAEVVYVGFWRRCGANLIDGILMNIIVLPILYSIYGPAIFAEDAPLLFGPADVILRYILPIVLVVLFWVHWQATPGKMLVSAKIVDAKTFKKAPPSRLILRYFAYILSALPLCLGFFWIAFDSRKQGWHDKLAGTVVVRDPKGSLEEAFK